MLRELIYELFEKPSDASLNPLEPQGSYAPATVLRRSSFIALERKSEKTFAKNIMREQLIQQRQQLSAEFRNQAEANILKQLENLADFQKAKNIAAYLAIHGEVETKAVIEYCWKHNKNVFLPLVQKDLSLRFYLYEKNDLLSKNKFGILEPSNQKESRQADELDLVLVPLVGFDEHNHRLGMGAGCYDRTFANKKAKPLLIGLAYAFQKIKISPNPWDVAMDKIIMY